MKRFYPLRLKGEFDLGFALGYHTYPGSHERTPLGEKMYQFKYQTEKKFLPDIVESVVSFINTNRIISNCDLIIPMPPSKERQWQPVSMVAKEVGKRIGKFVAEHTIHKTKQTPELKAIETYKEKAKIIKDAFYFTSQKAKNLVKGKKVLLINDLYDTGATADEITRLLKRDGQVKTVYVLAVTKTKERK